MILLKFIRILFILTAFNFIVNSEKIQSDIKVIEREKELWEHSLIIVRLV